MLFPDESAARRENGYYCPANLPRPGERVDILGETDPATHKIGRTRTATVISSQPPSQASLYGSQGHKLQPVPGFADDCSVTVQYDDGTTESVSAAERPKSLVEEWGGLAAYVALQLGIRLLDADDSTSWEDAEERHEELLSELQLTNLDQQPPASGEYWGSSEESDEGDQAVRSTITFGKDGSITGRGIDGADGAYRIKKGRWGKLDKDANSQMTVAWIEEYDEGFRVVVKGRYNASDGKVSARFTSSRGVGGTFALAPKPSIF